ncbi:hypothetical protein GCM10023237_16170 [Streptomyces coeruleoprunus]
MGESATAGAVGRPAKHSTVAVRVVAAAAGRLLRRWVCFISVRLLYEPCGWRAAAVDRRGPVGRNADQAAGTGSGSTSL